MIDDPAQRTLADVLQPRRHVGPHREVAHPQYAAITAVTFLCREATSHAAQARRPLGRSASRTDRAFADRVSPRGYRRPVVNFAVTLVHAHNWDTQRPIREQDRWADHAAFMDGLVDEGFIVVGGPLGNGEQTLHLVNAPDEEAVRSRLSSDPWAEMDLLEVGSVTAWSLWLDGRNTAR